MAAGSATRMADLTGNKIEKSFLRLGGRPIIRIVVDRILKNTNNHPRSVTIVAQDRFSRDFTHEFRDLKELHIFKLTTILDTATNYFYAAEDGHFLPHDVILLHYADTIIDLDYDAMYNHFLKTKAECMIAVTERIRHDYSEIHMVHQKSKGMMVQEMIEKPWLHYPTWTGVAMFRHSFITKFIDPAHLQDFARDIFPNVIDKGKLKPYLVHKDYYDTGNVRNYTMLKEACDKGVLKL